MKIIISKILNRVTIMKKNILFILALFISFAGVQAQSKTSVIIIKTKIYCDHCAECGSCKERILNELKFTKGIKAAELDVAKQEITINYFSKKITIEQIKEAINKTGYDADEQLADAKFVGKLDECCLKKE